MEFPKEVLKPLPEPESGLLGERLDHDLAKIRTFLRAYTERYRQMEDKLQRQFYAERIYDPDIDAPLKLAIAVCLPELGGELRRGHSRQGPTYSVSALRSEIRAGRLAGIMHRGKLTVTRRAVRDWLASLESSLNLTPELPREKAVDFLPDNQKSHRDAVRAQVAAERARAKLEALKVRKTE